MFKELAAELEELKAQGLYRFCRSVEETRGGRILLDGQWVVHLASNSYLGLHMHPRVVAAAKEATERFGTGAGSARLIGGTFSLHEALEEELAAFKQAQACLVFPTGYMANLGVVAALVGQGDLVIGDELNHASLVDACRLSRASFRIFPHRDVERLSEALEERRNRYRRVLIVTEGLFSMDGDQSPLAELAAIARRFEAWLLVDDAHGTGVLGEGGRGSLAQAGVPPEGILQVGTLSKALGSLGGFVAGPREVIEILRNRARSFIYTTASPAGSVAAAREALRVLQDEPIWRERLWESVRFWTEGLQRLGVRLLSRGSPIVPIWIGSNDGAVAAAQALLEAGVFAPAIRPPTVPKGSARIRTSVTALHSREDLELALGAFEQAFRREKVTVG